MGFGLENLERTGRKCLEQKVERQKLKACRNGETKVVQQLLEHCSTEDSGLNVKGQFGFTALMEACKHGHKDVVQLLLDNSDKNIDLNARNHWGRTALMWACRNGHKDVVQLFLDNSERNIDLNARSDRGLTALMYACIHHGDIYRSIFKNNKNIFAVGPSTIWKMYQRKRLNH